MYQYTIKLYKNHSENTDVQKNLTDEKVINGVSRVSVNILSPVIELQGYEINEYNYCYIDELKRYYFIEQIVASTNGIIQLTMKVDVLMSYIDDIKASKGMITKNRDYNPYAGDFEAESRYTLQKYEFPNGFDSKDGDFVFVTMRG